MRNNFPVGCKVVLTAAMREQAVKPELFEIGTVTREGSYGIYDVQWNGLNRPIGMRADEITEA